MTKVLRGLCASGRRRGLPGCGRAMGLALLALALPAAARADSPPAQTASAFYDALVGAMKQGPTLGFGGRRQLLDPEIRRDFNLPLMTRLVVGPPWRSLPGDQQQALVDAFSAFSIATYANRFRDFSGERFVVDLTAAPLPSGDVIVHTKLFTGDGETVQLDYLMRENRGRWQIIDVFLTGTISELAARRSEFSSILRQGGAAAMIELLKKKTAELSG